MRDWTFQKIMSDPNFDPHGILEDALVEYVKNHPEKVAGDKVALKWLIRDPTIIAEICPAVDINDLEMLTTFIETVGKHDGYQGSTVKNHIIGSLVNAKPENAEAIFTAIVDSWKPSPKTFPSDFIAKLKPDQINQMVKKAIATDDIKRWDGKDWAMATTTTDGVLYAIECFAGGKMTLDMASFPVLSRCASVVVADKDLAKEATRFLMAIDQKWKAYVCFKCGYGADVEKRYSRRRGALAPRLIASISGYTLHRKKCDPENTCPSPHEIITRKPKQLTFECNRCGEIFTTLSGLTLHVKACR